MVPVIRYIWTRECAATGGVVTNDLTLVACDILDGCVVFIQWSAAVTPIAMRVFERRVECCLSQRNRDKSSCKGHCEHQVTAILMQDESVVEEH